MITAAPLAGSNSSGAESSRRGPAAAMPSSVHISNDEQLRRFKEREKIPWKVHKITDEDWRNRDRWDDYKMAINDMVSHTSTEFAPWTLVPGNDKKVGRVEILKTFCDRLEEALS